MNDEKIRSDQILTRQAHQVDSPKVQPILVGDTVSVKNRSDKHKANDMYIVTSKNLEKVKVQRLLHPLKM